jgi:hypothetical protein
LRDIPSVEGTLKSDLLQSRVGALASLVEVFSRRYDAQHTATGREQLWSIETSTRVRDPNVLV